MTDFGPIDGPKEWDTNTTASRRSNRWGVAVDIEKFNISIISACMLLVLRLQNNDADLIYKMQC